MVINTGYDESTHSRYLLSSMNMLSQIGDFVPSSMSKEWKDVGNAKDVSNAKYVSNAKSVLLRFQENCASYLTQRILARILGDRCDRETWCDAAETYGIITVTTHTPGGCLGRYVDSPDVESGVIYCNTAQSLLSQARVVCHELAHALMCIIPDLMLEVDGGEAMIGRQVNEGKVRHEIACIVTCKCIPTPDYP
jgi:hypothetical protein